MVDRPGRRAIQAKFPTRTTKEGALAISVTRSVLLLLALCAATLAPGARAYAAPAAKQASIIIDANTGKVLHAQAADELRFPASLTKMMTLYILFGEIEQGRLSYDSKITFSQRATTMPPSKLGLKAGEQISVLEAIKVLVVKSANDVAVAVAETIGGSEYQFARLMTERARQIGMSSTTFRNASGLPNPSQKTTARDMATLGIRLQDDFPEYYRFFSTASVTINGKTYKTHNTLMRGFPGMDGIKTGYTRASGFNLVSSVRADGKHVVGAVFGGKTAATRNALMRSLLYTSLAKASTEKTRKSGSQLIAKSRPAAKPPIVARADAGWAPKMKKSPPQKAAKTPVKVAAAAPPPAPAVRPPKHDPIGAMLAEGDAPDSDPVAETSAPVGALPPPRLDLAALRAAMAEPEAAPASAQASAAAAPQDIAGLIRNSIVEGEARGHAMAVADAQPDPAARPPSTLDSQARALAFVAPAQAQPLPPAAHLKGPTPTAAFPPAPKGVGYEIQIGAYTSAVEAQAKLEHVRGRAVGLLDGHGGVTLPVQRDNRQIFRARFVNFDEHAASNTCLELRRLAIDCFVMKAD
jgi:D-alanyl-D-alanine carboxypeptidase